MAKLSQVKPPSVSGWKKLNRIPESRLIRLAVISEHRNIATRKELFPATWSQIWPDLAYVESAAPLTQVTAHN